MVPPATINVLDQHGGFTCETTGPKSGTSSLWRPGHILKTPIGTLQSHNERSFYQLNNNVTKAVYKVAGYRYPVLCWFDNTTGKRIA